MARTGSKWRHLPDEYGKCNSVFRRYRRWVEIGVFDASLRAPAASGIFAERLARLRAQLQRYVDEGKLAGAVLRIQQDCKLVFSQAVGWRDKEARDPMREDTIFRIASRPKR